MQGVDLFVQEAEDRVPCALPDMRSSVPAPEDGSETKSLSLFESRTQKASLSAGREGSGDVLHCQTRGVCSSHVTFSIPNTDISSCSQSSHAPFSGKGQTNAEIDVRLLEQRKEQHDKIKAKYIRFNTQVVLWVVEPQNPEFPMEMDGSLGTKQLFLFLGHL